MNKQYKTAIIGAGDIAALFDEPKDKNVLTHAHAYLLHHKEFMLCGFADPDYKKAQAAAKKWGGAAYRTIDELIQREHPEVVSICTPDETHLSAIQSLRRRGILGGILEKPLALDLENAYAIAHSELVTSGRFLVNFSRLFVPEFQNLKKNYRNGMYGELLSANGYYGKGLIHSGSHMISLLFWLFGSMKVVKKFSKIIDFSATDPNIFVVIQFQSGANGVLHAIDSHLFTIFELDLLFEKARVKMVDSGNRIEVYGLEESKRYKGYTVMKLQKNIPTSLDRSLSFAVKNLYHWLEGSRPPLSTVDEALTVQKICQDIILSK